MKSNSTILKHLLVVLTAAASAARGQTTNTAPSSQSASAPASQPLTSLLEWETDYAAAINQARQTGRPVLVRAGAVWCGWCKALDKEIAKPQVQSELRGWVRIYVDVDRPPREARSLAIGPVPALRILDSNGRLIASRDGYMKADDLLEWLQTQHKPASVAAAKSPASQPSTAQLVKDLLNDLDRRDPAVREAAIRRLMLVPDKAALPVIEKLSQPGLAGRLAALEIVQEWGGPVDGLDPWQPDTLTPERLEKLRSWAVSRDKVPTSRPSTLTAGQLAAATRDIQMLLQEEVTASEAQAIRERLTRYGQLILPIVYEAVGKAQNDRVRERLTSLRYRLVASDETVFTWPGGIDRLAALDVETRHAAADELVGRCGKDDEQLLLELFSDSDGLVREIALRGLQKIGGAQAGSAMVRLLQDPEPNVRAAVLKQMAESPSAKIVPAIADYTQSEKDPDLLVHAIRVLRSAKGKRAAETLMTLLDHANWQVRAEAAEGLGEIISDANGLTSEFRKKVQGRLLGLLDDSDGFVVSVAVKGLHNSSLSGAADALAKAADKHPELAEDVLQMLAEDSELRMKAIPHLRRFCAHQNSTVRAVAIRSLCTAAPTNVESELAAALADSSSRVRCSAAGAFFQLLEAQRPQADVDTAVHIQAQTSLFGSLFGGTRRSPGAKSTWTTTQAATEPAGTQPATQPTTTAAPEMDSRQRWLQQFRTGSRRPKWMNSLQSPLEAMLKAESAEERVLAAVDLVAFGRDEAAIPVITAAVKAQPELAGTASGALPWLTWESRLSLFEQLSAISAGPGTAMQISQNFAIWQDPRASGPLWNRLADPQMKVEDAARMLETFRRIYFGDFSYSPSQAPIDRRKQAIADAVPRTQSGPELQRTVALALLLSVSPADAAEQSALILADASTPTALRRDALQIQLLGKKPQEAQRAASESLSGEPGLQRVALRYLALGSESMTSLRDGTMVLYYQNPNLDFNAGPSDQIIRVKAPAGVKAQDLRPLLSANDPETAALAGYLLATLKDPAGLELLVSYWRERARDDQNVRKLVYRAVVALDDDSRTPLLEEIYRTFPPKDYWLRDYYWTIRSMSGPNVLKLRKTIRDEAGMDSLR